MKKFLLTTFIFLLTATAAFSQDEDMSKRFIVGIEADYHNWNTSLSDYKIDGNAESDEDIDFYNDNYEFMLNYFSYSVMLGYDIMDNFQVFLMPGLASIRQETNNLNSDAGEPHNLFLTNDPGLKISLEFVYSYALSEKFYLFAIPEIAYISFDNMKFVDDSETEPTFNNEISVDLLDIKAGIYAEYDMGWIFPFAGALYQEYLKSMDFNSTTVDSFGNSVYVERELAFNQDMVFAGSLGFRVKITPDKYFTIRANIGNGFSLIGSAMFKI